VLRVPEEFATVQAAIDSARDGDTVLVGPGRYLENVDLRGRAIVLASRFVRTHAVADIEATVLDGSRPREADSASVVRIVGTADPRAALIGFTITGGHGTRWADPRNGHVYVEGGGVLCEFASPVIAYNIITGNDAVPRPDSRGAGGGGIRCGNGEPEIAHNVIVRNHGPYGGGLVLYYAAAHVHDNLVAWNTGGDSFGGAGFWIAGRLATTAPIVLRRNTIVSNRAVAPASRTPDTPEEAGSGGAILVYSGNGYENRLTGCDNTIAGNTQEHGPPIVARTGELAPTVWQSSPPRGPTGAGPAATDAGFARYLTWPATAWASPDGGPCRP
jgi:hypothetical protein